MEYFFKQLFIFSAIFVFSSNLIFAEDYNIDPELLKKFRLVEENGQTVVEVSMEGLLSLALERATTMDIIAIDKKIAREALEAVQDVYNPVFSTSVAVARTTTPSGTNMSGNVPYVSLAYDTTGDHYHAVSAAPFVGLTNSDISSFSMSWTKMTKLGIQYSLEYQKSASQTSSGQIATEEDPFSGWTPLDDPIYMDSMTLSVQVPLFQGWGDVNKLAEYKSQVGVEQTDRQSQKTILDLLNQVSNIYWDLVGVHKNIQTLRASVNLSEQLVRDTKTREQLGLLDSVEAKQSESQLLLVKQSLLQAIFRKKEIEDQIKVALSLEDLPYGYKPTEKMFIRRNHLDFKCLLDETYQNNQDLGLLTVALKMNRLSLKEAENSDRSDIDLSMQYKANGYGKDTTKASSGMSENDLHDYAVSLTWNVPLFDKVTPQTIRKINMERSRIDLQVANLKSLLKVQLQSILRNLKLSEEEIKLANTSANLVNDMLQKETEKFKLGNSTSFRVAQVQQDLIDAQKNETLAKVRYEKTYLGFLMMTEKIFSAYNLTIQ